jgi:hypothetical protein
MALGRAIPAKALRSRAADAGRSQRLDAMADGRAVPKHESASAFRRFAPFLLLKQFIMLAGGEPYCIAGNFASAFEASGSVPLFQSRSLVCGGSGAAD